MKIDFENTTNAQQEAETFVRLLRGSDPTPAATVLRDELERQTLGFFANDDNARARLQTLIATGYETMAGRSGSFWQRFLGPSRREQELSKQRSEALERAERAELSSFEAVAEMAEIEKQRDEALRELSKLREKYESGAQS